MATSMEAAMESLRQIKSTEPPVWLVPKLELSQAVRAASKHLFSCIKPHIPISPFDQLLIEGFDAEQIWQQIDLQSKPLLSTFRREVKKFEKNPDEISKLRVYVEGGKKTVNEEKGIDDIDDDEDDNANDSEDDIYMDMDEEEEEEEEEDEEEEEENRGKEDKGENEEEGKGGIEDNFLKINELQEYLEGDEAREFGLKKKTKTKATKDEEDTEDEGEGSDEDDDNDEAEEEEDELGLFDGDDGGEDDEGNMENARYEDFFGIKKNKGLKEKAKSRGRLEEDSASEDEEDLDMVSGNQLQTLTARNDGLSTHEKELQKLQSEIEQMEKANLDPEVWTMRGEVTAAQRQKNSALEVDLDFEHNMRPAPVITEEVTASLEDLIKTRIGQGLFDDVQKAPSLPSKSPREIIELDENKSKKGLGEVYEEEFVKKTDPVSAPLSFSNELKEASELFKKLCLKLDALSHFHFTPKPVVEDMSIQTNVPALAMEEIAPMAVSDAAMLAPEEVFAGKVDIKEEAELTKAERKRRRANKKRKFKAEEAKRMAKKPRQNIPVNKDEARNNLFSVPPRISQINVM